MGLPRGKRWIYDTGTLIPMIMRWPGKLKSGAVREDLSTVIDLAPTMLSVAGVDVPDHMHGRVLIGEQTGNEPPYLFFHRDRMDEVYELQRAARDRRWKYIRNYEPEKTYAQRLDYMDQMPTMKDWRRLNAEGKTHRRTEELVYGSKANRRTLRHRKRPLGVEQSCRIAQYSDRLERMRAATEAWQDEIGDMGLIPEAVMMEEMKPGGATPKTEPPAIAFVDNKISISCPTEGSSIVYQTKTSKGWSNWKAVHQIVRSTQGCNSSKSLSPRLSR